MSEKKIEPIHFTQSIVRTVEKWPKRTSFAPDWLLAAHVHGAVYEGDTITFDIYNGHAVYRLTGETGPHGTKVAELVEGSNKVTRRKV